MSALPITAVVEFMAKWSYLFPRTVIKCQQIDPKIGTQMKTNIAKHLKKLWNFVYLTPKWT